MTIHHVSYFSGTKLKRKSITAFFKVYTEGSWGWKTGYDSRRYSSRQLLEHIKRR